MKFNVKAIEKEDVLIINNETAQSLNCQNLKVTVARFGFHVVDINIKYDDTLPSNQICISLNILEKLKLPLSNNFLVKVENKEIVFGPYIGIYLGSGKLDIGWKYERLASFVIDFNNKTNGAMIAFTENDIDYEKLTVNAFCYDSNKDIWRKQNMPLPSVIHRYGDMNKKVRNRLRAIYGDNLFNYDEMDKWTEISALKLNPETSQYIPDTVICTNNEQFEKFIIKYDDVYFKPVKGRKGRGIHRILKESDNSYKVTIQSKKDFTEKKYRNIEELINDLSDKINSGNYILQKTIKLSINNRVIDFRIRFEKDLNNVWKQSIFAARVSDLGGVVSNRSAGGQVIPPFEALTKYYKFEPEKAKLIENNLIEAGLKITKVVESAHLNYGKCAVDLGLESDGTIYHIETNVKAPNDLTTRSFEGFDGLDRICILNTSYSKRLSGFKDVETRVVFNNLSDKSLFNDVRKNYRIILGSSSKDDYLIKEIEQIFINNNILIKNRKIKNFHIEMNANASEIELLEVFENIKKIDRNKSIRTILYRTLKPRKKITNKVRSENDKLETLEKELDKIKNSTSWKITKPIRALGRLFKKL